MRKAAGYFAIFMSVALLLLATSGANPAYAGGDKSPPGNNGTVKIVNDQGDGQDDPDNDPHVCVFHIYGFNFDSNSSGTWHIEAWPPRGGPLTATQSDGRWSANGEGKFDAHPAPQPFPSGHYKLTVKQDTPSTPGGDKQKVFWVECGAGGGGGGSGGRAEKVRTELQAAISNATSVKAQLATEIGVAGQVLATANLTAAQRAAIETALAATTAAQTALGAAITAANSTLAQLVTAIGSGNQSQINAAVNAAIEAIANLNAK